MKKLLFILVCMMALGSVFAQEKAAGDLIVLKETEFNFGKIPQGKPVYHTFEVINKSDKPLKLDNVTASCGCTTPEWSREEIKPGGVSKIRVGYNAASDGMFQKNIVVTYNGNETKQILIKGEVWKAPTGAAPSNASVQFLKQQIQ